MDGVIVIRFLANSRGENILFEKQKSGKLTSLSLRCFDTITSVVYIGSNWAIFLSNMLSFASYATVAVRTRAANLNSRRSGKLAPIYVRLLDFYSELKRTRLLQD